MKLERYYDLRNEFIFDMVRWSVQHDHPAESIPKSRMEFKKSGKRYYDLRNGSIFIMEIVCNSVNEKKLTNALEVTTRVCTTYSKQAFTEAILSACKTFVVYHRIKRPQNENSPQATGKPTNTCTNKPYAKTNKRKQQTKFATIEIIFVCYLLLLCFHSNIGHISAAYYNHNNKVILLAEQPKTAVTLFNNSNQTNTYNIATTWLKTNSSTKSSSSLPLSSSSTLDNSLNRHNKNGVVTVYNKNNLNNIYNNKNKVIIPTHNEITSHITLAATAAAPAVIYSTSSTFTASTTTAIFNISSGTSNAAATSSFNDTFYDDNEVPEIPSYIRTTAMFFCIVIMLMGVIGNVMVPIVIVRTKDMRNSTNIFLTNLSIADLLVLLICTPTVLVELNTKPETWVLGHEMCKAVPFVELTVAHASVLTILAISFERYYAICEPLKAGYVCTKTRAILICSLAWGIAALFTSPIILIATYRLEPYYDGTLVAVCFTSAETFWSTFYFVASIIVFFFIPFAILVVLYTAIAYKLLRRHSEFQRPTSPNINEAVTTAAMEVVTETNSCIMPSKEIIVKLSAARRNRVNSHPQNNSLRKHRKQVIFMLVAVVASFFLCLLPFRAFTIWIIASSQEEVGSLGLEGYYNILYFCRIMLYLNSALNPILYNLMSSKFRSGFWRLIVSCCRHHKRKRNLCSRHQITTYTKRETNVIKNSNSLRSRRPFRREATFLGNSISTSSGTERTSTTWRSGSVSTSVTGVMKAPESHSLAAAITDMSTAALTTLYFN
ncbi:thyrotropin-releasing hormone receptor [Lucilia cuprina]|uniref:thyrotropin-releasing hormone receptor n=1 Tax=Lucilia cuprina TaxID=7375 RepID=UPI001F060308|nr:thyrotropin-releasing hormone receptor [Lucilia cuprina]